MIRNFKYLFLILLFPFLQINAKQLSTSQAIAVPIANFSFDNICGGSIFFRDSSLNNPLLWNWDFGDGSTSALQHPTHTFTSTGTFNVKLKISNASGVDSLTKSISINTLASTLPAQCYPQIYSSTYSVLKEIHFNTIHKFTPDSNAFSIDNSCSYSTIVTSGQTYSISVKLSYAPNRSVNGWIDFNNDGFFDSVNEEVFNSPSNGTDLRTGNITIPTSAVANFPLRFRLALTIYSPQHFSPCDDINYGQYQDFSVIIEPNNSDPKAAFLSSSLCDGTTMFKDSTYDNCATSWNWDFDDGSFSTFQNPVHKFSSAGNYSVKLKICNPVSCDSIIKTVVITTPAGLTPSVCHAEADSFCCRMGIRKVSLANINNTSANASEGYQDFTCTGSATLIAGDQIPITVLTDSIGFENVKAWIDFNNDGIFNNATELVFQSDNKQLTHYGIISTSSATILNVPLRMRICDDISSVSISDACSNLKRGQSEDYAITFITTAQTPVANFIADNTTISSGSTVRFSDLSQNIPSSWQWYFAGGNPATSNIKNPSVQYNTPGNYSVTLVAKNSNGQDSIVMTTYIHVLQGLNLCSSSSSNASIGEFYDSGGPNSNYFFTQSCSFLINPVCATSITLTFSSFSLNPGIDYLYIYNGTNSSAPLPTSGTGFSILNSVTANSGKMYIVFQSSGSGSNYPGWKATWTSQSAVVNAPVASFLTSSNNPAWGSAVEFTDNSLNNPGTLVWDFGDGSSSALKNTSHIYKSTGAFRVTLSASNCFSTDTISRIITVQNIPKIKVIPDSINVTLSCKDSIVIPVTVKNIGNSDLIVSVNTLKNKNDTIQILSFAGVTEKNEYTNFLNAFTPYSFKKYKITKFNSLLPGDLEIALKNKDVLIFSPHSLLSGYNNYASIENVVKSFISSGKTVIICGSNNLKKNSRIYDMNLFKGSFLSRVEAQNGLYFTATDSTNPATYGIVAAILLYGSYQYVYHHSITDSDKLVLLNCNQHNETLVSRKIGKGIVYSFGIDCAYSSNPLNSFVLNIFKAAKDTFPEWLSFTPDSALIPSGDSLNINLKISSKDLGSGYFSKNFSIYSNSLTDSVITVPVYIHVTSAPVLELSKTCINFSSIMKNSSVNDTIEISNTGCDTLEIASIQSTDNAFTTNINSIKIAGGKTAHVIVTFNPINTGTYDAILHINNNFNNDTAICLTGTALPAPEISFNHTNLNSNLYACADSTTLAVYIHNTGTVNLDYKIQSPVRILAISNFVNMSAEFPNTVAAINKFNSNFRLETHNFTTADSLEKALMNHEVLLFPDAEENYSYSIYYSMHTVVQKFIDNGGRVVVCGSFIELHHSTIYDLGLDLSFVNNIVRGPQPVSNVVTTDSLMKGVPSQFQTANSAYAAYGSSSIVQLVTNSSGSNYVFYKNIGAGKLVYVGFDFFQYNDAIAKIIGNSIDVFTLGFPPWLTTTTSISGSIVPGDSALISLTLNSSGYASGPHTSNIFIASNDPQHPLDSVQVTMNVRTNPCADFTINSGTCNGFVAFTDKTFNHPTSWSWDFGDGQFSNLQNPDHTYTSTGTFLVKMISCSSFSCDSLVKQVTINSLVGPQHTYCLPQLSSIGAYQKVKKVMLGNINNTNSDYLSQYHDFTCSDTTSLYEGHLYPITVVIDSTYRDNELSAWIDYNNDNAFDTISEKLFTVMDRYGIHNGEITIPQGAIKNTPLRMRVFAEVVNDYGTYLLPCKNPYRGQISDFAVIVKDNPFKPEARFYYNQQCNATFSFIDSSENIPTSWFWDFGDGRTSTNRNEIHSYAFTGIYNVKLKVCNNVGCDSVLRTITVTSLGSTLPSNCISNSTNYVNYRGGGITRVLFNTIDKNSPDAIEGYQDNSCTDITTVIQDSIYPILLHLTPHTGSYANVWIDFNNDGNLDSLAELVFSAGWYYQDLQGSIRIPFNAVLNTPLRMRISAEDINVTLRPAPCRDLTYGQSEDYSVIIIENHLPVISGFSAVHQSDCNGRIVFTDSSKNVPASWLWDFGDGNTSTLENPVHTYSNPGTYVVKMLVCKMGSCDSTSKTYIINAVNGPVNVSCIPSVLPQTVSGSMQVNIGTINKTSTYSPVLYQDFSCTDSTKLEAGVQNWLFINSFQSSPQSSAAAWLDYNNDGDFDPVNELLISDRNYGSHSTYFTVPVWAVKNTALRLRVLSSNSYYPPASACATGYQYQDFKVIIVPEGPKANYSYKQTCSAYVFFKDTTLNNPTTWTWNFGDGHIAISSSPQHAYSMGGTYYISLIVNYGTCVDTLYDTLAVALVGLDDFNGVNLFELYPNPFNEKLNLSFKLSSAKRVSLKMLNVIGDIISAPETDAQLPAGNYHYVFKTKSAGVYFIEFTIDGVSKVQKVVKLN